jgi:hypothetical protein
VLAYLNRVLYTSIKFSKPHTRKPQKTINMDAKYFSLGIEDIDSLNCFIAADEIEECVNLSKLPSEEEELLILNAIEEIFGIGQQTSLEILYANHWENWDTTLFYVDYLKNELAKKENELYKVHQALKSIENGDYETVEVQLVFNNNAKSKKKTLPITNKRIVPGILNYLKSLDSGKPITLRRGRRSEDFKKKIFKKKIDDYTKHLQIHCKKVPLTEEDELAFSGFLLAYNGLVTIPEPSDYPLFIEFRREIAKFLKYYK